MALLRRRGLRGDPGSLPWLHHLPLDDHHAPSPLLIHKAAIRGYAPAAQGLPPGARGRLLCTVTQQNQQKCVCFLLNANQSVMLLWWCIHSFCLEGHPGKAMPWRTRVGMRC